MACGALVLAGAERASAALPDPQPSASPSRVAPVEIRTRHARFRAVGFDELPGWKEDDLLAGWPAFSASCAVLKRRDHWREVCSAGDQVPRNVGAVRAFFESHFVLLRILNSDASREGEITGYFEPLLDGRARPDAEFDVPVLGVPRDMYSLDWSTVPAQQRQGVVHVQPDGNTLKIEPTAMAGSFALDLSAFDLDTRDRRLRIRLTQGAMGRVARPYYTRAELAALGLPAGVDAPVLAWVRDPMALYAMQVQGSGRIRMGDSSVMRLQYADQNGHPFRPLRVVAKDRDRVVTRGLGGAPEEADQFELEETEATLVTDDTTAVGGEAAGVVTRGLSVRRATPPPAPAAGPVQGGDAAALALVEQLLSGRRASPVAPEGRAVPAQVAAARVTPKGTAKADAANAPAPPTQARTADARSMLTNSVLNRDPSYVFFKAADEQGQAVGPQGALGVPLTPERSVAVDPRVTPLGYPLYLAAPAPAGSSIDMYQLVFAQDTGGAIRGAVRADYFWGFGSKAGRMARSTKHKGQMWLMMPKEEVAALGRGAVVTRGLSAPKGGQTECLVADETFCQEVD
jgi:membrane-bound lytic murein transglycosylase A